MYFAADFAAARIERSLAGYKVAILHVVIDVLKAIGNNATGGADAVTQAVEFVAGVVTKQ